MPQPTWRKRPLAGEFRGGGNPMDSGCRMLVADDSHAVRRLFREVASRAHMPVTLVEASDGNECKRLLMKGEIHLAFIDVFMPGPSGIEVIMAARRAGSRTFMTLMSEREDEELFELARQLKVYEFLIKPFTIGQVQSILRIYNHIASPLHALIIDGSETAGPVIQTVLAKSVFRLVLERATDASTAIALCKSELFDIAFLNCTASRHDASAIVKRLTKHNPAIKIVMMTSEDSWNRQDAATQLGAAAFVEKPFSAEQVD